MGGAGHGGEGGALLGQGQERVRGGHEARLVALLRAVRVSLPELEGEVHEAVPDLRVQSCMAVSFELFPPPNKPPFSAP